jgi:putative aldouronate transport system permease protein
MNKEAGAGITRRTGHVGSLFDRCRTDLKRYKFIYLLLLPGVVYLLVFRYYPMYFLQIAFKDYSIFTGLKGAKWVGFANFVDLFKTKYFLQSFRNTLIISGMKILLEFPVPVLLALLLNEIRQQVFKRSVQTIVYLPHFLSWVIVGSIWINLLSPSTGLVNGIIKRLGGEPIFFMADKSLFRWVLVFVDIWKSSGWGTIIYLAAITGIDQQMYEAARIDGAGRFRQMFSITLPTIMPTVLVVFILGLAKILNIFEQVFVMYNPVVAEVGETIDTYVYQVGMVRGDMSFATTVGLFKNVISLALVLLTNAWSKRVQGASVL